MTSNDEPDQVPIEELLARLQKADSIFDLTRGVGHEINNMMQTIVGSLELVRKLIEAGRGAETARFIESAKSSARNAATLVDRLVSLSRRSPLHPSPLSMNDVIAEVEQIVRASLPRFIKLELALADGLWDTCCDRNEAEIALVGLVLDVRSELSEPGEIALRTQNVSLDAAPSARIPAGDYVCITVTVSRAAKAPEVTSADGTLRPDRIGWSDAGPGLRVARRFACDIGGAVETAETPGGDTSAMLYLPRRKHRLKESSCRSE